MNTKVSKWGNGLGIRIKKDLAELYNISPGTSIELRKHQKGILMIPNPRKKPNLKWLCEDQPDGSAKDEWGDMAATGLEEFWKDE